MDTPGSLKRAAVPGVLLLASSSRRKTLSNRDGRGTGSVRVNIMMARLLAARGLSQLQVCLADMLFGLHLLLNGC